MNPTGRWQIGMYWGASCGGCDVSLLEIGEHILDLIKIADIAFWPCVADFKYATVAGYPDGWMDLCLVNGGVRNSEQEEIARLLRQKSRTLVAYGACASDGGIPALANLKTKQAIFDAAYHDNPSIDNPAKTEPLPHAEMNGFTLEIPELYDAVLRLKDIVNVDYEMPGCPPQADDVWEVIEAFVSGAIPPHDGAVKIGCGKRTVCDECTREKRLTKIKAFRRHHEFRPEPNWCLLEQGVLCLGPATCSGCGALCPSVGMRCEGCHGAARGVTDQGAAMMGALGTLVDAETEAQARELIGQIVDPAGTLYRFSLSGSHLKVRR